MIKPMRTPFACFSLICVVTWVNAEPASPSAALDWQRVGVLEFARTETTIAQFRRFAEATGYRTQAEREGGGHVYEAGFVRKPGWTWQRPFGSASHPLWPAVHVNYAEAQAFCAWAGGRLPTDTEWVAAAYTEQRSAPPSPWVRGTTYRYPTGDTPQGAQCLEDCGKDRALPVGTPLWRGHGPALAGQTVAGVNGLHDMGANVWEWVDEPVGPSAQKRTRGGSWWYGEGPMRADHLAMKDARFSVVYIGFRCVRGP